MDKKFTFQRIDLNNTRKFSYTESAKDGEYVKNGDDNQFPQHLIELYNKSSVHAAAVNAIVQGIIGGGLTADEDLFLQRANSHGESWNSIFEKIALDFKLHGSFALEVIYSNDRSRIEVYHIDFSYLRAAEKDHRGHIPGYYVCSNWGSHGRMVSAKDKDDIMYLPTYNPQNSAEEPSQIYVCNNYRPGQEYYPLPDYVGALKVIELDMNIDEFHTANIKNGLAPSLAITTYTNGSDDQLRAIQDQLNDSYGGAENAGALLYMDVDSSENAPVITPIPQNGADGYYTTVNDLVVQKILTAHRITSPMILGIKTEGQLGGRTEMLDAYLLLQNTVIIPLQQDILKCLEELISYNYPDAVIGVEQKRLLDDGSEEEVVVTDRETTDEEQVEVEQPEVLA